MPRPLRRTLADHRFLHVTTKAVSDDRLIASARDRAVLLDLWDEHLVPAGIRVLAFALMPNHTHALVEVPSVEALSDAQRAICRAHARRVNLARGRTGDLYRDRFHARPFRDEAHRDRTARYIERNPLGRGGIDALLARDVSSLPWIAGLRPAPPAFLDVARAHELFGGPERYLALVADPDDHAILRARIEAVGVDAVLRAGWPQREVAAALGLPRSTLRRRLGGSG